MSNLTIEQQAVSDLAASNPTTHILVKALAGTGKTSTILKTLPRLKGSSAIMAFNKSIAEEVKSMLTIEQQLMCQVGTVHSFGFGAWRRKMGNKRCYVKGSKLYDHLSTVLNQGRFNRLAAAIEDGRDGIRPLIVTLANNAKQGALGVNSPFFHYPQVNDHSAYEAIVDHNELWSDLEATHVPESLIFEAAIELVRLNNADLQNLDFNDMLYFPLLYNADFQQFNNVIIDEAQDLNAPRIEIAMRSSNRRVIGVGDPHQAIYGFSGALSDSMDKLREAMLKTAPVEELPLSVCFRCDPNIIAEAQAIVPAIQHRFTLPNMPDPTSEQLGTVDELSIVDLINPTHAAYPKMGDAILCRLNRPIVATAFQLLKNKTRARIEGRDIGRMLMKLLDSILFGKDDAPVDTWVDLVETYVAECIANAGSDKKLARRLPQIEDSAECLVIMLEEMTYANLSEFRKQVEDLFQDDITPGTSVILSSVHKAKGREWPRVYLLGRDDYMPHPMAKTEWQLEQEDNLIYVAVTRAERHLTYVTNVKQWLDDRRR